GKIYDAALDVPAEFAVISKAYQSGVPCPQPRWIFPDLLGRPAMVSARVSGESIGRRIVRDPSLAAARAQLAADLGPDLARITAAPLADRRARGTLPAPNPGNTPPKPATQQMEADLARIDEPHPALELVLRWLRRNEPPPPARHVLVHGDFRIGNALVTPAGL